MAKKKSDQRNKIHTKIIVMAIVFTLLIMVLGFAIKHSLIGFNKYSFVDTNLFPLWQIAPGVSVIGGILYIWKFGKQLGVGKSIAAFSIIAAAVFFATGVLFSHLNHILDPGEPVEYTAVIEDKHYESGERRAPTRYEFTLTVQGDTLTITVPSSHYYGLKEGDLYRVAYHKGAFNEPYYIAVGGVEE